MPSVFHTTSLIPAVASLGAKVVLVPTIEILKNDE
jgi:hypothetical protein